VRPIRPYKVTVYNRATDRPFADFYTNQIPNKGDHITIFSDFKDKNDPFLHWGHWVVDSVVWCIAARASVTAFEVVRECDGDMSAAYCEAVDLHVWPAEGPHWTKTPKFSKVLSPPDDDEEDDEE